MKISEMFLPEFDQEMANTRKTLERIPEDKLDWKPHEKSMTLGRLAGHLAAANPILEEVLGPLLVVHHQRDGDLPLGPIETCSSELCVAAAFAPSRAIKGITQKPQTPAKRLPTRRSRGLRVTQSPP